MVPASSVETPEPGDPGSAAVPALSTVALDGLSQVVSEPVVSPGVDTQKGRVGALCADGKQSFMDAGQGWQAMSTPERLRPAEGERDEARIYFGRDNQPRIMGSRFGADGPRQLYLRFHRGVWQARLSGR